MQAASQTSQEKWQCTECGSQDFADRDGYRWCIGCGTGTPILDAPNRVPGVGSNTHCAPENKLCFGRDLGNPGVNSRRNGKALYQVIGRVDRVQGIMTSLKLLLEADLISEEIFKSLEEKLVGEDRVHHFDVGLRGIQLRNECMRSQEVPISQRMKSYGSALCKQYGFGDNVLLSNALGFDLKWIATILTMQNDGSHSKDLATATFLLTVKKFCGNEKAGDIMRDLWGTKKEGKIVVSEAKKRYIAKARDLIRLDKLVI